MEDFTGHAKTYKGPEDLEICNHLINSPAYISHLEAVKWFGSTVIKEMIERNLLNYRPDSNFSRNFIPSPLEPVLTAPSKPALRAMAELVTRFSEPVNHKPLEN
jgi:hypothetical protein